MHDPMDSATSSFALSAAPRRTSFRLLGTPDATSITVPPCADVPSKGQGKATHGRSGHACMGRPVAVGKRVCDSQSLTGVGVGVGVGKKCRSPVGDRLIALHRPTSSPRVARPGPALRAVRGKRCHGLAILPGKSTGTAPPGRATPSLVPQSGLWRSHPLLNTRAIPSRLRSCPRHEVPTGDKEVTASCYGVGWVMGLPR